MPGRLRKFIPCCPDMLRSRKKLSTCNFEMPSVWNDGENHAYL